MHAPLDDAVTCWQPFTCIPHISFPHFNTTHPAGERPPITQEEWLAEFAKYQASPEFRLAHSHMTVEDFKFIYFMEWAHRMWGR